ncbi:methionyl-tRNA formyltransferase [Flavobacteriales bacterium]|nr:methionyl-tRNA formyltransferase [Flavobacteriales bacterium]
MRIAIIGRSRMLFDTMLMLESKHEICLVITSKEAPEYDIKSSDYKKFAVERNIPFYHAPNISEELHNEIKGLAKIDVAVSINYTGIISQSVIDLFALGILNVHGGDLPKYRGNACQSWAILNGEDRIGLCVHKMIGGELDSGKILAREFKAININTRVGILYDWLDEASPRLVEQALEGLKRDANWSIEQQSSDPKNALRCYPRKPEDGEINWKDSAEQIVRLVNASSEPFAGAFCNFQDEKLIIWRIEMHKDEEVWCGIPGQIASINEDENYIIVLTGNGKVKIREVQLNNNRFTADKLTKSIRSRLN